MVQNNRDTQFLVRCSFELRDDAQVLADELGQSLVEWVRRAIKNEIDRQNAEKKASKKSSKAKSSSMTKKQIEKLIESKVLEMKKNGVI